MLIEINALQQELPALLDIETSQLCELLPSLGFPVDAVEQVAGTTVLDVDITANRGDAMSHRGLARDLAARLNADLAPLPVMPLAEGKALLPVRLETEACPIYATAILELGQSAGTPVAVQAFLANLGASAKNLAPVDASNEILHRYGHPTHAFDADTLKGALIVRWARAGEKVVTLDGVERTLAGQDLVIADEAGPIALAGVMGGDSTKVTTSTKRVLLESAYFDPRTVRAMARRHGLHTDASHRFGRGADPAMARVARDLLAQRLVAWAGATLVGAWTAGAEPAPAEPIKFCKPLLQRIAGESLRMAEAANLLKRLGCEMGPEPGCLQVIPPTWRHDLILAEDLAEEVLRLRGYDQISSELPPLEGSPEALSQAYVQPRDLARRLGHLGFHQAVTLGFISPEADAAFSGSANPPEGRVLGNPLGLEYSVLRASILPSLLAIAELNLRQGAKEVRVFETAPVFTSSPEGPQEEMALGLVWAGTLGGEDYLTKPRSVQPADLLGVIRDLGYQGRLEVRELGQDILAAEIRLAELPKPQERCIPTFTPFSRFPTMERDLSLLVNLDQAYLPLAAAMTAAAEAAAGEAFQDLRCVDVFRHKSLPEGRQAWLMRARFQHPSRTLTHEEVDGWMVSALAAAASLGAELRA